MNLIDPATLDRWQAVCDAATEKPWTFYEFSEGGRVVSIPKGQKDRVSRCIEERRMRLCDCCPATALHWVFAKHDEQEVSNLKFIALARTALPLAIADLATAREECERLRGLLRRVLLALIPDKALETDQQKKLVVESASTILDDIRKELGV